MFHLPWQDTSRLLAFDAMQVIAVLIQTSNLRRNQYHRAQHLLLQPRHTHKQHINLIDARRRSPQNNKSNLTTKLTIKRITSQTITMVNQNDFETLNSTISDSRSRRPSRASIKFFQTETSTRKSSFASTATEISARNLVRGLALDGCDHGLIGSDGKIRDEYILQRQSINHPANLTKIPFLCDLAAASSITEIDGWVFTMLLVSGFAKLSSKINELNTINVFPIADGDTGANMKVCLKLPTRNLLLNPSDNILIAASNMAADVLLNGQGNSGKDLYISDLFNNFSISN